MVGMVRVIVAVLIGPDRQAGAATVVVDLQLLGALAPASWAGRRPAHRARTKANTNKGGGVSARPLPIPINPALLRHAEQRRKSLENRIADQITRFAGSMLFVYLHIIWFSAWIILGVEHYPYGLLTMIVSLEAIFLSTFVMISQNREAARAEVRANLDFETNLTAEVLVRAIAKHTGVDMVAVNEMVRAEIERTAHELETRA